MNYMWLRQLPDAVLLRPQLNAELLHFFLLYIRFVGVSTVHTVTVNGHGILTNDLPVMSLSSFELRSNNPNLFNGVTADISEVESDYRSV